MQGYTATRKCLPEGLFRHSLASLPWLKGLRGVLSEENWKTTLSILQPEDTIARIEIVDFLLREGVSA